MTESPVRVESNVQRTGRSPASPSTRRPRRALHGVLLLDKPLGWTSNDALQKAKGILRAEKAGHTGTLDPLATGLLPLCFGAATKFAQVSLDADKRYEATLALGRRSSTGDLEGELSEPRPVTSTLEEAQAACQRLTGSISQRPPMHSALKHQGRALYEWARDGVEVDRAERAVVIHRLDILRWQPPEMAIAVTCSKGTYIRTLAEDLGELLGCGAHLVALRRTGSGALDLAEAIDLPSFEALDDEARVARLLPPDVLLRDWPAVTLDEADAGRFLCGLRRRIDHPDTPAVRVYGPQPGAFLGTGHIIRGELIVSRLLSPQEVQALMA